MNNSLPFLIYLFVASTICGCSAAGQVNNASDIIPVNVSTELEKASDESFTSAEYDRGIAHAVSEELLASMISVNSKVLISDTTTAMDAPSFPIDGSSVLFEEFKWSNLTPKEVKGTFDIYADLKIVKLKGSPLETLQDQKGKFKGADGLIELTAVGTVYSEPPNPEKVNHPDRASVFWVNKPKDFFVCAKYHTKAGVSSFCLMETYHPSSNSFTGGIYKLDASGTWVKIDGR